MKLKLASILVVAFALSGCAGLTTIENAIGTVEGTSISPQAAATAIYAFNAVETVATGYGQLPSCNKAGAPITCNTPQALAAIKPAILSGRAAKNNLLGLLQSNNGGAIPVASYNTLEAAISSLQNVYVQYGIK